MIAWLQRQHPRVQAVLSTAVALTVLLIAWWQGHRWYQTSLVSEYRTRVGAELALRANALSLAASERFAVLEGLHTFVQIEADSSNFEVRFERFSSLMCTGLGDKSILYISVAPEGVVQYVYPFQENKALLGYAPLQDPRPEVRADGRQAIVSRQAVLSSPYELIRGDVGLVAQQALYVPAGEGQQDTYWGLVSVGLDLPSLLAEAEIAEQQGGLEYALRDGMGHAFYGVEGVFASDPVVSTVALPDGAWELAAAPSEGWNAAVKRSLFRFSGSTLLISLLLVALTYLAVSRQARLAAAVSARTRALRSANEQLEQDVRERKKTEAALRTSEASFRALFEQAPFAIQICASDGRTLRVNEAFEHLWGCGETQIAGANILDGECQIPRSLGPSVLRAFSGEAVLTPAERYTRQDVPSIQDGRDRWIRTSVYPVRDEEEAIRQVIVVDSDVTLQTEAEEALRQSEERFRSAFEHAAFGMALVGTDGRFLQVNSSFCAMLGYLQAELLDKTFQELTYPDDLQVGTGLFRDLMSGRRDYGWLEKRYVHRDGHVIWALLSTAAVRGPEGTPLYLVSQIQDITERKQAEAQLTEKEEQYRSVFEATRDGLIITAMDGNIVEINPAACQMYGYERHQLIGKPILTLIQLDYHTLFGQVFERIRRGEGFVVQAVDRRSDGSTFHAEIYGSSFVYAGQLHMLSVIRDITERVQARQLLEERVQERTRELSTLLQVSRAVVSTLQTEPLVARTLNRLGEIVPYHAAAIFGLEGAGDLVMLGHRGSGSSADLPHRWRVSEMEHIRMVLDRREPLVIPDIYADSPRALSWQESWGGMPGRLIDDSASWLGIPLLAKQGVIGLLVLEHRQVGYFTPRHSGLALALANQVAVALENARLYERSQRIGVLEERQRIARELHDSVSQVLYSIGLGAHTARELLDLDPSRAVGPVEHILSLAEAGLSEMRALIFELRPEALEREGLVSALAKRADALRARHRLEVTTELGEEPNLSLANKEALYRVAQEALNNVVKHARATRVTFRLEAGEGRLDLTIEDDGVGFDPQAEHPGHLGLHTMRERIEELGGTLEIESASGRGTAVQATVPTGSPRRHK